MKDNLFIPEHSTNVLPLRWLANGIFHPLSMVFFNIGLRANDKIEWDYQYKWYNKFLEWVGWKSYNILNKPYEWWGTTYVMDLSKLDLDKLVGPGWDDYDENGHPYWYYTEWQEDQETGDAWRLVKKDNNGNM